MTYPLYIIFGVLPSVVWLLFYLRKDKHPESNPQVLRVFFYGILVALPAIVLELSITQGINKLPFNPVSLSLLNTFLGVALVEEVLKFLVVKEKVLNHAEFDEPIDAVLYMIIAALGFAAFENILVLLPLGPHFLINQTFTVSVFRFLGATFLHTLCSGTVGYFLALALFNVKNRAKLISLGLGISILLHGLYNFYIMKIEEGFQFILIPSFVLIGLAVFLTFGFKKLQKMKSVCKIN
jgi:RsiW-degrading membrane proteinase PrsW (M82 family)